MDNPKPSRKQDQLAYSQGTRAYIIGETEECPYTPGGSDDENGEVFSLRRYWWWMGWYDQRLKKYHVG